MVTNQTIIQPPLRQHTRLSQNLRCWFASSEASLSAVRPELCICFSGSQRLDQSYSACAHIHPSPGQLPSVCHDVSCLTKPADPLYDYHFMADSSLSSVLSSPRYFFPRQILIPQFWTPRQQVKFRGVYHSLRAQHHWPIIAGLQNTGHRIKAGQLQSRLQDLCAKVRHQNCGSDDTELLRTRGMGWHHIIPSKSRLFVCFQLQSGQNPTVSEILAVRGLFSKPPLSIKRMKADHMVSQNSSSPAEKVLTPPQL